MKAIRHAKIRDIVENEVIETQEELTEYLNDIGEKAASICEQTEEAVNIYKEIVDTYTVAAR